MPPEHADHAGRPPAPLAAPLVEHAAAYARQGYRVVPLHTPGPLGCSCGRPDCASVGKHPRTANGKDDATRDLRRIAARWSCWPGANIGIVPADGVVVLDVDPRNGGSEALADLLAAHQGALPNTLTCYTGGGGVHIYLACPGPYRGQLVTGVDIKSSSGYVVAPPSLHASGDAYRWAPGDPGIALAPPWLRQHIRQAPATPPTVRHLRVSGGTARDEGLIRTVARAVNGNRNRALYWAARCALERGAPPALLDQLRAAALAAGLDQREGDRTIRSAMRRGRPS